MKQLRFIIPVFFFSLLFCATSIASTVAIFPLLDLTRDSNGVNFTLTESLRQRVVEDGFEVLPEKDVINFMIRHRIRNLGILNDYQMTQLSKEMGVQYAFIGTVCQLGEMPTAKISVTLQLIRTTDKEVVWSTIKDLHKDDLITFLALGDPKRTSDLYEEYFSTLLDTMPRDIATKATMPLQVEILSSTLSPRNVKAGEKVKFNARIYTTAEETNKPSFKLTVDDKTYDVEVDDDGHFITSSWLAQDLDGSYAVSLIVEFPSGKIQVLKLGEYIVDSIPPVISVNLLGKEVDGKVYFSDELKIMTSLQVPERITMWDITVYDEYDEPVVHQAGGGAVAASGYLEWE